MWGKRVVDSRITPWPFSGATSKTAAITQVECRKLIVKPGDVQRTVLDPKYPETIIM